VDHDRPRANGVQTVIKLAACLISGLLLTSVPWHGAFAVSDAEIREVFKILDTAGDGKVTRDEFNFNKVAALYYRNQDPGKLLTFEQMKVTRAFFDAADTDHKGVLDAVKFFDAVRFERIDHGQKNYITFDDLERFLREIRR
jgi:Ca2+-binding EF-hand superfamily protein